MKAKNQRMKRLRDFKPQWIPSGQFAPLPLGRGGSVAPVHNARQEAFQMRRQGKNDGDDFKMIIIIHMQAAIEEHSGFGFQILKWHSEVRASYLIIFIVLLSLLLLRYFVCRNVIGQCCAKAIDEFRCQCWT